jgi:microcystin-dependent protein
MSEPFLGQIMMVGFNFPPRGWANCDGQLLPIAQNTALYSLLDTMYGGDGRTTFGLPDLRGRVAIHTGRGPGLSDYKQGTKGGAETVTLLTAQMPAHAHGVSAKARAVASDGNQASPVGHTWASDGAGGAFTYSDAAPDQDMKAGSVVVTEQNVGGSQMHENRSPYQVVRFVIALVGLYPSRS